MFYGFMANYGDFCEIFDFFEKFQVKKFLEHLENEQKFFSFNNSVWKKSNSRTGQQKL